MRFNDTIYKVFVVINFTTFIFISYLGIDYLLPRDTTEEVVISTKRKVDFIPRGMGPANINYRRGGEKPSEDTNYLVTNSLRFKIDRIQKFGLYQNDSVKIYQGRLSGRVFEAGLLEQGFERKISREPTLYGNLIFVPIIPFSLV